MSDSVDRVFVHALNTVKKIPRTGSARPPPADRLKLYGLYKQSMEGDVDSVMTRPTGDGDDTSAERDKWDAWNQQRGLSKTESKRRYITTLIETMHKYASTTPDARELVSELEFVWDQIKSNAASSNSSSPQQPYNRPVSQTRATNPADPPLRLLSPTSEEDNTSLPADADYDDAPDDAALRRPSEARHRKWRRRVELALARMTTEVAALREQLESSGRSTARRKRGVWAWMLWATWVVMRHIMVDAVLVGLVALWVRRRGMSERVDEGARRVLGQIKREWREGKVR
ncbi:MAG: hypothetical protein M1833_001561 [Piccolia ochrophora]|nr:MAG: hypothetical protein M1833_001561 [Piccolia ochrophora]